MIILSNLFNNAINSLRETFKEEIKPEISIYFYDMNVEEVSEMVGKSIELNDRHKSIEREDLVATFLSEIAH